MPSVANIARGGWVMVRVLMVVASLGAAVPVTAAPKADFFVATSGSDAWSGTLPEPNAAKTDGPFLSPARALVAARQVRKLDATARPVVLLRGGRYELVEPLVFAPGDSGTVLAAYPNEIPVLSGGRIANPKLENGLWVVPVPDTKTPIRFVTVGGELRHATRFPKEGHFTIGGLAGVDPKVNYRTASDAFEFAEGQIKPEWAGTGVEVVVLHFWVAGHYGIKNVDTANRVITLDRKSIRRFTEDGGPKPGRFYLLNVPGEIGPGEFHHDRAAGVIRYRPHPGEAPERSPLIVPRLDAVLRFDGQPETGAFVERVELRGLTVCDSTWDAGPKIAGDLQAAQHVPGSVRLRGARGCAVTDCRFVNLGGYGIELVDGCRENRIVGNELTRLGAGGIKFNGGSAGSPENLRTGANRITGNHIHHVGEVFHAGVGILSAHADHTVVSHNHIHHLFYTGISVGWVWGYAPSVSMGNVVEFNRIHDVGQKVLSDMGGIYMLGVSPGTVVRGNVIHDVESWGYGGWGIYTDEGSTGITIENNLVYRTKSGGFHQHYGKDNLVRNNIFAFAREGQIMRSRAEPHRSFTFERNVVYFKDAPLFAKNWKDDQFAVDHNLYWEAGGKPIAFPNGTLKEWQARGFDRNSVVADPLFIDPEKGDYRFRAGSPISKIGFVPFDSSVAGPRPREKR